MKYTAALHMDIHDINPAVATGHGTATFAIIIAWLGWLTPLLTAIATIASIVWFTICIWESSTVQHWNSNRRMRRHSRKLAKLKAKELKTTAAINAMEAERQGRMVAREIVASAAVDAAHIVAKEPVATLNNSPPNGQ